jgi:hypothetical protein
MPVSLETVFEQGVTPWMDPAIVWAASATSIGARSAFPRPCGPYVLVPSAYRVGMSVTLRVEGRPGVGCTSGQYAPLRYDAEVLGLPAGTLLVRVVHTYRDWAVAPETVFVGVVTIPALP